MNVTIILLHLLTLFSSSFQLEILGKSSNEEGSFKKKKRRFFQKAYKALYHESYKLKVENIKLKKTLNKIALLLNACLLSKKKIIKMKN